MTTSAQDSGLLHQRGPASGARRVKIGIDVGGTFTHAVALDAESLELIGKAMVPTTHRSKNGVAEGVVNSMRRLLESAGIRPDQVALIAHSTTQATNALLEGDVAPVGILGMSPGRDVWRARGQSAVRGIELAPGKFLPTYHRFYDSSRGIDESAIRRLAGELKEEGAQVFVVSEAYGIENRENEQRAAEVIRSMGEIVTAAAEISELYGLRVRTRTAVINACMLPKMLETANLTDQAVREAGITSPLMIMRSDGGIMSIEEMRRRPILTMLSGPAAGVAAALMYVKISDGLFFEVGGTSTDVSIIRNGRPMIRAAEVNGYKLYVRTLDIRTVGIGGGSMVRAQGRRIIDVGPRSAHIAGLRYPAFSTTAEFVDPQIQMIRPSSSDPDDYIAFRSASDQSPAFALTTTDAANVLGVPGEYARGNQKTVELLAACLTAGFGRPAAEVAQEILWRAGRKASLAAQGFIREYKLDPGSLVCVGGGGGAEVVVPPAAEELRMTYSIAQHAEVISAIGVALGMIRDTVERSCVNPTADDIVRIRADAESSVARMGAAADSIDVFVEVNTKQKKLVATATGTPDLQTGTPRRERIREEEARAVAAASCGTLTASCTLEAETENFLVYRARRVERRLFGLVSKTSWPIRVVDRTGVIRLKCPHAEIYPRPMSSVVSDFGGLIDAFTTFGDAGGLEPDVFVLAGARIIDLGGLVGKEQMLSVLRIEAERFTLTEQAIVLLSRKQY